MKNIHFGFIEDNVDPLNAGRCKVRIVGLYDSLKKEDLPWLMSISPVSLDTMVKPPKIGEQVICISLDEDNQTILILGIVYGINEKTSLPDTPKEARGDTSGIVSSKSSSKIGSEPDASSTFGAIYPKNRVLQTESGHCLEFDDTSGKERINIYHRSGTYIEMINDGSVIIRAKSNEYEITGGEKNVYVGGDETEQIIGKKTTTIGGNLTTTAPNITMNASGVFTINGIVVINGGLTVNAGGTGTGNAVISGNITTINGNIVSTNGNVTSQGTVLHTHTHGGTQSGTGSTGVPN